MYQLMMILECQLHIIITCACILMKTLVEYIAYLALKRKVLSEIKALTILSYFRFGKSGYWLRSRQALPVEDDYDDDNEDDDDHDDDVFDGNSFFVTNISCVEVILLLLLFGKLNLKFSSL